MYKTLILSLWYSSNRTVVVLLHKHFNSRLSASCNSVSVITNCTYTTMSVSNIHLFQVGLLRLFYLVLTAFRWFFTWLSLGDVDLCVSLIFVTKSQCCWSENCISHVIYHRHKPSVHVTDGLAEMSVYASLHDKCGHGLIVYNKSHWIEIYCINLKNGMFSSC